MKFIHALCVALLFVSCLTEEQQQQIEDADSPVTEAETGIDTFIVAKGQSVLDNETPEGESLRVDNDSAIENIRIAITGSQTSEDEIDMTAAIVKNPDVGPAFPGGSAAMDAHIQKHLIYPAVAFQNDITGTVNVRFVVEADGRLTGIVAQNHVGYGCDESAIDLIKGMPKWTPGRKGGVAVRCSVVLPITFTTPE
jgi:TonB family protein